MYFGLNEGDVGVTELLCHLASVFAREPKHRVVKIDPDNLALKAAVIQAKMVEVVLLEEWSVTLASLVGSHSGLVSGRILRR